MLARLLQSAQSAQQVAACLREYEKERARRVVPLTVRSNVMGALLQLELPPVRLPGTHLPIMHNCSHV